MTSEQKGTSVGTLQKALNFHHRNALKFSSQGTIGLLWI